MSIFESFSMLVLMASIFAYINFRFLRLPPSIGLMVLALATSLILLGVGVIHPPFIHWVQDELNAFDFSNLLLGSMLSFMLFAGAIHIDLKELRQEKLSVLLFSTLSVIISTFLIGFSMYYLLDLGGIKVSLIHCLLFGSLISPTDPIAVIGILKEAKISKSLEMKIAGESLFNDGVAVVVFLTLLQLANHPEEVSIGHIGHLLLQEALGGIVFGLIIGYIGFLLLKSIDNYKVEVLITLALVMAGYVFSGWIHVSGPLAMVAAGILIGNQGKAHAMSDVTAEYVDKFWEMLDEAFNAILFVLIGLELLVLRHDIGIAVWCLVAIVIALAARYISVFIPSQFIKMKQKIDHATILVLTWGGLRGGISIALALSLENAMEKELWVPLTYAIVAFSIIVQGLTIGKLAQKLRPGA